MKALINYSKEFDTLIICIKDKIPTKTKKIKEITLIYFDEEIIGINIEKPSIKLEAGMYSENKLIQDYVKKQIDKYIKLKFDDQFIIGKIIECVEIKDTHLHLCKVDIGIEVVQIVCGAANAKKDINVICATVGSWMPNGMQIKQGKLRGFDSFGMLCSIKELQIKSKNINIEGIAELDPKKYSIGKSFFKELYKNEV